jgi:hypothetical protein
MFDGEGESKARCSSFRSLLFPFRDDEAPARPTKGCCVLLLHLTSQFSLFRELPERSGREKTKGRSEAMARKNWRRLREKEEEETTKKAKDEMRQRKEQSRKKEPWRSGEKGRKKSRGKKPRGRFC